MAIAIGDLGGMSPDERLALARALLDSLEQDVPRTTLTESQRAELKRRLAEYEANPNAGSCWEDVKARLAERK
jgi:putative addiction module component (TIGR02574 family)